MAKRMGTKELDPSKFNINFEQRKVDVQKIKKYAKRIGISDDALPLDFENEDHCLELANLSMDMYLKLLGVSFEMEATEEQLIKEIIPRTSFLRAIALLSVRGSNLNRILEKDAFISEAWIDHLKDQGLSDYECVVFAAPISYDNNAAFDMLMSNFSSINDHFDPTEGR